MDTPTNLTLTAPTGKGSFELHGNILMTHLIYKEGIQKSSVMEKYLIREQASALFYMRRLIYAMVWFSGVQGSVMYVGTDRISLNTD